MDMQRFEQGMGFGAVRQDEGAQLSVRVFDDQAFGKGVRVVELQVFFIGNEPFASKCAVEDEGVGLVFGKAACG